MVVVRYHDDLKEVQGLGEPQAPFDRASWFAGLAAHGAFRPVHALARSEDGCVVLPLTEESGRLDALANWYTFRWRPLVGAARPDHRLLEAIARDLRRRAWRVTLAPLPDEDGSATALAEAFAAAGWKVRCAQSDVNHVLVPAGRSFAEYLAARPGALRTTLKRKVARLAVTIDTRFDPASWAAYERVYAASWKPAEGAPAFLRAFAESEGAAGRLRLGLARSGGEVVAAQFWTVENGTAWIHKLAHLDSAGALSPGTVLTAALLEMAIDRDKASLIDFGTGDDAYKRDWMEAVRPRFRLDALNPSRPRAWPHLLRRLAQGRQAG